MRRAHRLAETKPRVELKSFFIGWARVHIGSHGFSGLERSIQRIGQRSPGNSFPPCRRQQFDVH